MNRDGGITGEVIYFGKAQQVMVDGPLDWRTSLAMSDRYVSFVHCETITFMSSLWEGLEFQGQ